VPKTKHIDESEKPDAAKERAVDVALERAERCRVAGQYEEGIRVLADALDLGVDCAMIHFRLGNLFIDQGNLGEAERAYLKAIELDPHHAATTNNLAVIYKRTGRMALYVKTYKRAQRLELRAMLRRGPRRRVEGSPSSPRRWGALVLVALAVAAVLVLVILYR
jgi:tetratricopeptide (TPR) repeat protein